MYIITVMCRVCQLQFCFFLNKFITFIVNVDVYTLKKSTVALHNYKSDKLQIGCRNKWDCLYDIVSSAYSIKGKIVFCGYAERYPAEQ